MVIHEPRRQPGRRAKTGGQMNELHAVDGEEAWASALRWANTHINRAQGSLTLAGQAQPNMADDLKVVAAFLESASRAVFEMTPQAEVE